MSFPESNEAIVYRAIIRKIMKKIEIIPIAKKKLLRRGISEKMVIETMTSPIQIVKGYGERRVAHRKYFSKNKEYQAKGRL